MRWALVVVAVFAGLTVSAFAADPLGTLDRSGDRLLARGEDGRVCLVLVEPEEGLRLRRCLSGARAGVIRSSYVDGQCTFGTRLFGLAPQGTRQVNLAGYVSKKPVKLRLFAVPSRIHRDGGVAFVVRRSLAGSSGMTLTAYDGQGQRLAQKVLKTFPIAGCTGPPAIATPARG